MKKIIKPNLSIYFLNMPIIGMWIEKDYEKAKTTSDLLDLVHKWLNISESTNNQVKKNCYYSAASVLYSILRKKTFESKILCM